VPLFILAICSVSSGFLFKDLFIGLGTTFFQNTILIKNENYTFTDAEFIPSYIKLIPIYFSIESALLSVYIGYNFKYLLFY
jgi:NADH-ubiquinone oxidoreductase chain 5